MTGRFLPRAICGLLLATAAMLPSGCKPAPVAGTQPASASAPAPSVSSASPVSDPAPSISDASPASPSTTTPSTATHTDFSLPIGGDIAPAPKSPAPTAYTPPPSQLTPPNGASSDDANIAAAAPPIAAQPLQPQAPERAGSPSRGSTSSSTVSQTPLIHLSAGIAVPQSLPGGTVMGMSVDYALRGGLNRSSRYAWVIKSTAGDVVTEVQLDASGNLSAFFQQLKPEHRPFSARIEELSPGSKRRVVVSNELPLKTDY